MNLLVAKKLEEPAQLPDAQPLNKIDMFCDRRIGFAGKRDSDDFL